MIASPNHDEMSTMELLEAVYTNPEDLADVLTEPGAVGSELLRAFNAAHAGARAQTAQDILKIDENDADFRAHLIETLETRGLG